MPHFVEQIWILSTIPNLGDFNSICWQTVNHEASRFYLFDKEIILFRIIQEKRKPEIVKTQT